MARLEVEEEQIVEKAALLNGGLGPALAPMISAGVERMRLDCAFASQELTRACESFDVKAPPGTDLLAALYNAWDKLMPEASGSAFSIKTILSGRCLALPSPASAQVDIGRAISDARNQGRNLARADLAHFVARREAAWWAKVWSVLGWAAAVVFGGLITRGIDTLQAVQNHGPVSTAASSTVPVIVKPSPHASKKPG